MIKRSCSMCPYTGECFLLKAHCREIKREYKREKAEKALQRKLGCEPSSFPTFQQLSREDDEVDYVVESFRRAKQTFGEVLGLPKTPMPMKKYDVCQECPLQEPCSWRNYFCKEMKKRFKGRIDLQRIEHEPWERRGQKLMEELSHPDFERKERQEARGESNPYSNLSIEEILAQLAGKKDEQSGKPEK